MGNIISLNCAGLEIEDCYKLRGKAYKTIVLHKCGSLKLDVEEYLYENIFPAALSDYKGTVQIGSY